MRLLFFGTYDTGSHPRVAVLRDGLVAHGATVLECNAPLGLSTASRVSMLKRPWTLPLLAWKLARCWSVLTIRSQKWRRGDNWPDAVVVGYLGHFDVLLARRLFPHVPIVLDHLIGAADTAGDRGVSGGVRQKLLTRLDSAALGSADHVVVDTDEHRDALPQPHRSRALVVAVGAPDAWFAVGHDPGGEGGVRAMRVVFFGLFTPLQGTPTIGAALAALADDHDVDVTMIGTGQDLEETQRLAAPNPRVHWVDWVDAVDLPAMVAAHDVCLGIVGTGRKALRVVPNKVFQGAAAGCALVTSDTAPQRRVLGDAAVLVPPGDPVALADALRALAADRSQLAAARAAAKTLAHKAFSPYAVTTTLYQRLLAVVPRRPA